MFGMTSTSGGALNEKSSEVEKYAPKTPRIQAFGLIPGKSRRAPARQIFFSKFFSSIFQLILIVYHVSQFNKLFITIITYVPLRILRNLMAAILCWGFNPKNNEDFGLALEISLIFGTGHPLKRESLTRSLLQLKISVNCCCKSVREAGALVGLLAW